jgi:tetratricopeptide (TPR) repeat protein
MNDAGTYERADDSLSGLRGILARARGLEASGAVAEALTLLESVPKGARGVGLWHLARGSMLARTGRLIDGIGSLREAAGLDPHVAEVHASLGAALLEQAREAGRTRHPAKRLANEAAEGTQEELGADPALLAESLEHLRRARSLRPRLPATWSSLGLALFTAGRLHAAYEVLEEGCAAHPGDSRLLFTAARTLAALGEHERARATVDQLLDVDPECEQARTLALELEQGSSRNTE